jgi:hypothetical protein
LVNVPAFVWLRYSDSAKFLGIPATMNKEKKAGVSIESNVYTHNGNPSLKTNILLSKKCIFT